MLSMRSPWRWVLTVAVAPKMARCTYVRCGSRVDVTDVGVDCTSEMDVFSVRTYLVCGRCVDSWICHTHLHSVCEPVQPTYFDVLEMASNKAGGIAVSPGLSWM